MSFRSNIGVLFSSVLVVNRHEGLYSEETDSKVLTIRDDVTTEYVLVDTGTRGVFLFQFLNYSVVDDVPSFVYNFDIRFVRSADDDV
jgi:hypothetical protein